MLTRPLISIAAAAAAAALAGANTEAGAGGPAQGGPAAAQLRAALFL